jgi:hypothetical protein
MKSRYASNPLMNGSVTPPWFSDRVIENAHESAGPPAERASSDSSALVSSHRERRAARVATLNRTRDTVSVVCVGPFNVDIAFDADPLQLQMLPNQIVAATRAPSEARLLRDRVIEVLRSVDTVPVARVELNRHIHFRMQSEEELRRVMRSLVPIDIWQRHLINPSLVSMAIREPRTHVMPGQIEIQISASISERDVIEVTVVHHFELPAESVAGAAAALIAERWDDVMCTALVVADELIADILIDDTCPMKA